MTLQKRSGLRTVINSLACLHLALASAPFGILPQIDAKMVVVELSSDWPLTPLRLRELAHRKNLKLNRAIGADFRARVLHELAFDAP